MDGVLIDSEPLHKRAKEIAFAEFGIVLPESVYAQRLLVRIRRQPIVKNSVARPQRRRSPGGCAPRTTEPDSADT